MRIEQLISENALLVRRHATLEHRVHRRRKKLLELNQMEKSRIDENNSTINSDISALEQLVFNPDIIPPLPLPTLERVPSLTIGEDADAFLNHDLELISSEFL